MASIRLNDFHNVPPNVIIPVGLMDKLTSYLNEPPYAFSFQCSSCYKIRCDPYLVDPGLLRRSRTCEAASTNCRQPADPGPVTPPHYVPGSLVLVQFRAELWPGIVEFSIDEHQDYRLTRPGEDTPYANYVSLINVHPEIGYAGWYSPQSLVPFVRREPPPYLPQEAATAYRKCNQVFSQSLRLRLVALSLLAARLRKEGFEVYGTPQVGATEIIRSTGGASRERNT